MIEKYRRSALVITFCGLLLHAVLTAVPAGTGSLRDTLSIIASGLMLFGMVEFLKVLRLSRDPEAAEEMEAAGTDERIQFIRARARSLSLIISVFAELAAGLAANLIFGQKVIAEVLNYTACAQCVIYAVVYRVMKNRY